MKKNILIFIAVIIVLLGVIYYFVREGGISNGPENGLSATTPDFSLGTSTAKIDDLDIGTVDNTVVPEDLPQPIPSVATSTINIKISMATKDEVIYVGHLTNYLSKLQENPGDLNSWLYLGMYREIVGDYDGAIIAWKYAHRLAPSSYMPLTNLGNLYTLRVKNLALAEQYFNDALKVNPLDVYPYIQIAGFFEKDMNNKTRAIEVVRLGLKNIPGDEDLNTLLANLIK